MKNRFEKSRMIKNEKLNLRRVVEENFITSQNLPNALKFKKVLVTVNLEKRIPKPSTRGIFPTGENETKSDTLPWANPFDQSTGIIKPTTIITRNVIRNEYLFLLK